MNDPFFVPIVEGHGEVEAVPILIRRIFAEFATVIPRINPPIRVKAGSFLHDASAFNRYVAMAAAKAAQGNGAVLILLDCEDECPGKLGPELLLRAQAVRSDVRCHVVLAKREYETWFLAAASSLAGCAGLPTNLSSPHSPEAIRGAKEWLGLHMDCAYDPIRHQVQFTSSFDLRQAKKLYSFDRFIAKLIA